MFRFSIAVVIACFLMAAPPIDAAPNPHPTSRFLASQTGLAASELSVGAATPRDLYGPDVHRYIVRLKTGEFASAHVRQLSGNLVATLFDPDGRLIDIVDRNVSGQTETLDIVAGKSGEYAIQIASFEWDVPLLKYDIRLVRHEAWRKSPEARAAQLFESWYDASLPGAAMAVLRGDKVVLQRSIGMADIAHGAPITPRTRFDLASTSKMFTALAIGMLTDRGALTIDDEARRHIPELPSFKAPIRIRHLLYHTSGLRDWNVCFGLMGRDIEDGITKAEIIDFASRQKELNFLPGTAQEYSNTGYNVLAEIVARVSGQSFPAWVRKNIFEPAGMNAVVNEDARVSVQGGALSYAQSVPVPLLSSASSTAAAGSSSMQASLEDMIAWARTFRRIKPGAAIGSSLSGKTGALDDGTSLEYGLGLWFRKRKDIPFVGHLGLAAGYRISFRRFPVQDLTFIFMTNDGNDGSYLRAETIENLFLGVEADPIEVPDGEYEPAPAAGPPDARLQEFAGLYYSDELRTAYEIDSSGSALTARHAVNGSIRLLPSDKDAFGTDRWYMPGVTFVRDKGNRVSGLLVTSEGARNILFRRVAGPASR